MSATCRYGFKSRRPASRNNPDARIPVKISGVIAMPSLIDMNRRHSGCCRGYLSPTADQMKNRLTRFDCSVFTMYWRSVDVAHNTGATHDVHSKGESRQDGGRTPDPAPLAVRVFAGTVPAPVPGAACARYGRARELLPGQGRPGSLPRRYRPRPPGTGRGVTRDGRARTRG